MAKYLDPKADLTFKKVFGEHKELLISFLNALLPLPEDKEIVELEYLPSELVPVNPDKKDTIVDVRCKDKDGRQFIVEMQMYWTNAFKQRALLNTCKAYSLPADRGEKYSELKPVYTLSLVNDIAFPESHNFGRNRRHIGEVGADIAKLAHTDRRSLGLNDQANDLSHLASELHAVATSYGILEFVNIKLHRSVKISRHNSSLTSLHPKPPAL